MSNKRHKDLWMPTSHRDTGIIQGYTASTPWGSQGNFISTLLPGCARTTAATTFGPGMITPGTIAPGLGTSYRTGAIGKREGARRSVRDNDLLARKGLPNPTPMRRGLKLGPGGGLIALDGLHSPAASPPAAPGVQGPPSVFLLHPSPTALSKPAPNERGRHEHMLG